MQWQPFGIVDHAVERDGRDDIFLTKERALHTVRIAKELAVMAVRRAVARIATVEVPQANKPGFGTAERAKHIGADLRTRARSTPHPHLVDLTL